MVVLCFAFYGGHLLFLFGRPQGRRRSRSCQKLVLPPLRNQQLRSTGQVRRHPSQWQTYPSPLSWWSFPRWVPCRQSSSLVQSWRKVGTCELRSSFLKMGYFLHLARRTCPKRVFCVWCTFLLSIYLFLLVFLASTYFIQILLISMQVSQWQRLPSLWFHTSECFSCFRVLGPLHSSRVSFLQV